MAQVVRCLPPAREARGRNPDPTKPHTPPSTPQLLYAGLGANSRDGPLTRDTRKGHRASTIKIWLGFLIWLQIVLSVSRFEHKVKNILILKSGSDW